MIRATALFSSACTKTEKESVGSFYRIQNMKFRARALLEKSRAEDPVCDPSFLADGTRVISKARPTLCNRPTSGTATREIRSRLLTCDRECSVKNRSSTMLCPSYRTIDQLSCDPTPGLVASSRPISKIRHPPAARHTENRS